MAIALDAHTAAGIASNTTDTPSPQTFSHTCGGSDRLLIVTAQMRGGSGGVVTGVTYNGVAMTEVATEAVSGSAHCTIFYLVNPASGTNTVSVAHSLTGGMHLVVSATSLTGVNQSSPLNASNKAAASSAGPMTTSVTTTVADCWVIDSCAMRTSASNAASMTAVTNRVKRTDFNTATNGLRGLVSTIGPAAAVGSHTTEWTKTLNHDWAIMAAAFAPVSAGTPAPAPDNATSAHTATSPTVTAKSSIAPADATHGHSATSPTVSTSVPSIAPANAAHAHAATSPTISAKSSIAPASATHAHAATSPSIAAKFAVAPANASHAHSSTLPTILAKASVSPADALHALSSTSPVVSVPGITIEPDDALHGGAGGSGTGVMVSTFFFGR